MPAAVIAAAPDHPVRQHDDGSRPGMHDLDVDLADGRVGAAEVTAAAAARVHGDLEARQRRIA